MARILMIVTGADAPTVGPISLDDRSPYLVERRLRELGAEIDSGPAWGSKVVADGNLITGQNPQSSVATARAVLTALEA